jgi:hypothetical protein
VINGNNTTGDTGTDDIETYSTWVPGLTYDASANHFLCLVVNTRKLVAI